MVDRAESVISLEMVIVTEAVTKKEMKFRVPQVSTNDTVTLDNFTTIAAAYLCKESDGTTVAFTKSTNVLTVTEAALTNVAVRGYAYGT
jgi:hypothetical protein